ncbi:monocarboxylate transporter [Plectosphaerella plurivora]|uniref:Monocarboxylate transporter n=1 Tax=Plectosphaerella plurivora TaxID=936078 RepID=A0A9P8VG02_9PEZI|nr:monocarboxylate transporter [Plectosphaerella plurivora]
MVPNSFIPKQTRQGPYADANTRKYISTLLAAFMINFTACGILFGFGIYQHHYETMVLDESTPFYGASTASIDLIGTLAASLMTIVAPFVMSWTRHFEPLFVTTAGGVLFGIAGVLASYGKTLWHFQLAQGLLMGLATGLSFVPSMTLAPTWFDEHRGLAMGLVSSRTGVGGLVWAPILSSCIASMGFRNTLRMTSCVGLVVICFSGLFLDWEPSMKRQLLNQGEGRSGAAALFDIPLPSQFTINQRAFVLLAICTVAQSAAYYTPVFFMALYSQTLGYSESSGAYLTAASNACNAIGKIAMGFVADRLGRLNSFLLVTFLAAASTLGLWLSSTLVGNVNESVARSLFVAFIVLYGLFASAFISLLPVAIVELYGVKEIPRMAGVIYLLQGLAVLVGTPVAGVLVPGNEVDRDPSSYTSLAALVGGLMAVAALGTAGVSFEAVRVAKLDR